MSESTRPAATWLKRALVLCALAFVWCWVSGLIVFLLVWSGVNSVMILQVKSYGDFLTLARNMAIISAIAAPMIGICAALARPTRGALIVILGGLAPHLLFILLFASMTSGRPR